MKIYLPIFFSSILSFSMVTSAKDLSLATVTYDQKLQNAVEAYEKNYWVDAFTIYAYLADTGNAEAARIAYLMWRHGISLYKNEFNATPEQVENWRRIFKSNQSTTLTSATNINS